MTATHRVYKQVNGSIVTAGGPFCKSFYRVEYNIWNRYVSHAARLTGSSVGIEIYVPDRLIHSESNQQSRKDTVRVDDINLK